MNWKKAGVWFWVWGVFALSRFRRGLLCQLGLGLLLALVPRLGLLRWTLILNFVSRLDLLTGLGCVMYLEVGEVGEVRARDHNDVRIVEEDGPVVVVVVVVVASFLLDGHRSAGSEELGFDLI